MFRREFPNPAVRRFWQIRRLLTYLNLAMLGIFLGLVIYVLGGR